MPTALALFTLDGVPATVQQNKLDNARRMKADGMATELIAKYAGLTVGEIEGM